MPISGKTNYSHWQIHGNDYSEPEWKMDGTVVFDGFGLMTFRGTLQARDVFDLSAIKEMKIPMFGEELPGAANGFFVSKISKKLQQNQSVLFEIEAVGIEPRCKGLTKISCEPISSVSAEPIETHPDFITKIAGTPDAPLNGATFDKKKFTGFGVVTKDSSGPVDKSLTSEQPLAGVRSYYVPKSVFRGYFHCLANKYDVDTFKELIGSVTVFGQVGGITLMPLWMVRESDSQGHMVTSINPEPIVMDKDGNPVIFKVSYEMLAGDWNSLIYPQQ
jgi:hypothetical protein